VGLLLFGQLTRHARRRTYEELSDLVIAIVSSSLSHDEVLSEVDPSTFQFLSQSEMQILKKMFLISLDKIPKDGLEERIIVGWLDSVRRAASKMKG
jgi:hypothetical protein